MYAYCVREFSKKTAVSHDRAGSGSPLTAQAIIQSKITNSESNHVQEYYYEYQYVKDRASRTQSESSLSNFAEAKSILEVKLQRSRKSQ